MLFSARWRSCPRSACRLFLAWSWQATACGSPYCFPTPTSFSLCSFFGDDGSCRLLQSMSDDQLVLFGARCHGTDCPLCCLLLRLRHLGSAYIHLGAGVAAAGLIIPKHICATIGGGAVLATLHTWWACISRHCGAWASLWSLAATIIGLLSLEIASTSVAGARVIAEYSGSKTVTRNAGCSQRDGPPSAGLTKRPVFARNTSVPIPWLGWRTRLAHLTWPSLLSSGALLLRMDCAPKPAADAPRLRTCTTAMNGTATSQAARRRHASHHLMNLCRQGGNGEARAVDYSTTLSARISWTTSGRPSWMRENRTPVPSGTTLQHQRLTACAVALVADRGFPPTICTMAVPGGRLSSTSIKRHLAVAPTAIHAAPRWPSSWRAIPKCCGWCRPYEESMTSESTLDSPVRRNGHLPAGHESNLAPAPFLLSTRSCGSSRAMRA